MHSGYYGQSAFHRGKIAYYIRMIQMRMYDFRLDVFDYLGECVYFRNIMSSPAADLHNWNSLILKNIHKWGFHIVRHNGNNSNIPAFPEGYFRKSPNN